MFEEYKVYIPDLNYWINATLYRYSILKYKISAPANEKLEAIPRYTFIELLFNDEWPENINKYLYLYEEIPRIRWPRLISRRLNAIKDTKYFYAFDTTSSNLNIFDLTSIDLEMLDYLLLYRTGNLFDFNIDYIILNTNLSKLIYLYLDLKINNNYERYNNENIISNKLLEYFYEVYLLGNYLEIMVNKYSF